VSQGISPSYLRWRGIEATLQLAQSSNSKVVMIGGGQNGMPINLNLDAAPQPPPASQDIDTTPKERTTAATPNKPSERTPADTLPRPSEKTPSVPPTEAQRVFKFPFGWSDIKALIGRIAIAVSPSETENPPASPAPQTTTPPTPPAQTTTAETPPNGGAKPEQAPLPGRPPPPGWDRTMGDGVRMPGPYAQPWGPPPPDVENRNGRQRN
jgi:hypothetical protein